MAAVDVVDDYLEGLPGETRRLAHGEWGVTLAPEQAAGWPLDVGLRLADGVLRAQAHALDDADGTRPLDAAVVEPPDALRALRLHARARDLGAGRPRGRATWTRGRSTACSGWWSRGRWRCGSSSRASAEPAKASAWLPD